MRKIREHCGSLMCPGENYFVEYEFDLELNHPNLVECNTGYHTTNKHIAHYLAACGDKTTTQFDSTIVEFLLHTNAADEVVENFVAFVLGVIFFESDQLDSRCAEQFINIFCNTHV